MAQTAVWCSFNCISRLGSGFERNTGCGERKSNALTRGFRSVACSRNSGLVHFHCKRSAVGEVSGTARERQGVVPRWCAHWLFRTTADDSCTAAAGHQQRGREQCAPAARLVLQLLVSAKSAFPEFVRVTGWLGLVVPGAWLAKVKLVGERAATGAVATSVPESPADCGLAVALPETKTVAERAPMTFWRSRNTARCGGGPL